MANKLSMASSRLNSFNSKLNDEMHNTNNFLKIPSNTNLPSNKNILLNPGPNYEIEAHDTCFYISLVKEENYNWKAKSKICLYFIFQTNFPLNYN